MKYAVIFLIVSTLIGCQSSNKPHGELYKTDSFTVYPNKVVQGENVAEVVSPTHIKSNYQSTFRDDFSRLIKFKISINQKSNEFPSGIDHWLIIGDEQNSPVITFGEQPKPLPKNPEGSLPENYEYTFKVDISSVLKQFEDKGYYEAYNGERIAKSDFEGFYLAGSAKPLAWSWGNLTNKFEKTDNPNIYTVKVIFNPFDETRVERSWKLLEDLSKRATYSSPQLVVDALFNLSMEEAYKNIEPDSTLRTGARWGGVWTRDVSYSTFLAFAYHEPEVAKISLRKKVRRGRIVQDTGSGGAWPVSSDRTTWVIGAWEIYKVTGDQNWLDEIYPIIKNSLEDDYKTIYDSETGMYAGESSFLDWRDQTYPKWMSNMDIYVSQNLGTNVVHYQAHKILAKIAKLKGDAYEEFEHRAAKIKKGINDELWLKDEGYYAQFLYGRNDLTVSPRYEALGESLAILFDVADEEKSFSIISKSPLTTFGAACIYPQIPGIRPYHNDGIWPFVQSYWNLAAAKTGNMDVLNHGLASIYRAGALFLTNYENMVVGTGDFNGTAINSDRMLWSMAGNLAMVHRVFIGMEFKTNGLRFSPVVPEEYGGERTLSNFKYQNAILDITVNGFGNKIKSVTIDGKQSDDAFIPNTIVGKHSVKIQLANNQTENSGINLVENHFTLTTPEASKEGKTFKWKAIEGAEYYRVYKNGKLLKTTKETKVDINDTTYASLKVSAVDSKGYEGFTSEPITFVKSYQIIEIENQIKTSNLPYTNFTGNGFVEVSKKINKSIVLNITIEKQGNYLLDVNFSNGSGPLHTDNKCAIRSLTVNENYEGVLVFPQRGKEEWSNWGYSNSQKVALKKGRNTVKIHFEDWNNNMNVEVNKAMLNHVRLISIN